MPNNKKVIPFRQPEIWTFYDWIDLNGSNPIEKWLDGESDEVKYVFNSALKEAQKTENHLNWLCFKRFLKGKYEQERLWEFAFKADRREYRVIGKFDGQKKAVLLCGCYHKGTVYTPKQALDTALNRARDIGTGKAKKRERTISMDF